MKRFIFISFAFLAAVFYILSGGSDFQPRVATIPQATVIATSQTISENEPESVQVTSLIASPAIASPSPNPTPVVFVAPPEPATVTSIEPSAEVVAPPTPITPIIQPLVLASLEQGLVGLTTAPPAATTPEPVIFSPPAVDIRKITATRVNMRDGPGTTFPVLTRLTLGHKVEILDDSGNGWLRLRTLPEERVGWISASLVSKANR